MFSDNGRSANLSRPAASNDDIPSLPPNFYGGNGAALPPIYTPTVPGAPAAAGVPVISDVALLDEADRVTLLKRVALPTLPFASEVVDYQLMPRCDVIRVGSSLGRVWRWFRAYFVNLTFPSSK